MSTLLYFATYGSENPTKATLPFFLATGALESGHTPQIVLGGESAIVIQDNHLSEISGVGIPPLAGLVKTLIEHEVPIYV